jgi:hypothetical protein
MEKSRLFPTIFLVLIFAANLLFWIQSNTKQSEWGNVPPTPQKEGASMMALGDDQLAYRVNSLMLQNFGSVGGRFISLKEYDYNRLYDWFMLEDGLDQKSNAVPMLAAYYFGAVSDGSKIGPVLDYLAIVGQRPYGEKWRWLGQAVFLARYNLQDSDKALELAYLLAANPDPDLADWAQQMPAFILHGAGKSEAAYDIMMNILISNIDKLDPAEINYMTDYICNTLLKDLPDKQPPPFCEK